MSAIIYETDPEKFITEKRPSISFFDEPISIEEYVPPIELVLSKMMQLF